MGNRLPPSPQVNVRLPTNKMLLAGSMVDWKKYADKAEAALDVWNVMMRNAPEPNMAGEIERLKANRNLFAGKYRSIIVLMDDTRQKLQEVVDHIQDEGDRAFFGSTNHADWLRDLVSDMDGWSFDAMVPTGDMNKMERDPYADCRQLRTALKLAIEHMAAFIRPLKASYSFVSLGEDMPGINAAFKSEGSTDAK